MINIIRKLSKWLPLACCILMVGCGKESVPPVIETATDAHQLADGSYEIPLRYSITTSGGPCFNSSWFTKNTYHETNWLYVKSLEGTQSAEQIILTTDAGKKNWPYAKTNLQGKIYFEGRTMTVQLDVPHVLSSGEEKGYVPYFLNDSYTVHYDLH